MSSGGTFDWMREGLRAAGRAKACSDDVRGRRFEREPHEENDEDAQYDNEVRGKLQACGYHNEVRGERRYCMVISRLWHVRALLMLG